MAQPAGVAAIAPAAPMSKAISGKNDRTWRAADGCHQIA